MYAHKNKAVYRVFLKCKHATILKHRKVHQKSPGDFLIPPMLQVSYIFLHNRQIFRFRKGKFQLKSRECINPSPCTLKDFFWELVMIIYGNLTYPENKNSSN